MALRQMEASWSQQQEADRILDEEERSTHALQYERSSCSDNTVITKTQAISANGQVSETELAYTSE